MESSKDSTLNQFDLLGRSRIFYTLFQYVDLLAGIDLHGVYSNLKTHNTDKSEQTVKPGISFNAGAMTYLGRGIGLSLIADYRKMKISEKSFSINRFYLRVDI